MNEKIDLELFYILPYTIHYDAGGYYRSDETCCTTYIPPSESIWNGDALFFEDKEELLKWFYNNPGEIIPEVYRIKYIDNYLGLDDVFKITNLKDGSTEYYTALNEDYYIQYNLFNSKLNGKSLWDKFYLYRSGGWETLRLDCIYEAFSKKGIKIKYDVYKKDIDKKEYFEYYRGSYKLKELKGEK